MYHLGKVTKLLTNAKELRVFSPPDKFEIFFQLLFGGRTLKTKINIDSRLQNGITKTDKSFNKFQFYLQS